jgi:hypothetical protein
LRISSPAARAAASRGKPGALLAKIWAWNCRLYRSMRAGPTLRSMDAMLSSRTWPIFEDGMASRARISGFFCCSGRSWRVTSYCSSPSL